ncbi:MAG TPA: type II toxin-antitoxin system VapC family toxin [Terriglobia bacterium]|nr:type II toxin-antitoxin system VapC family toxin [Terriglobia bacterium]
MDASAVIELLLNSSSGSRVAERVFADDESLHVPHLIDLEVAQVLRRYVLSKDMAPDRAFEALNDFVDLPLHRYTHIDFLTRIWELRTSLTAYDAVYVSLAEALDATLLTCDVKLGNSHGHAARIEVV